MYIIETKGREDEDDVLKFERLKRWCMDVNAKQNDVVYTPVYIKQDVWQSNRVRTFEELLRVHT